MFLIFSGENLQLPFLKIVIYTLRTYVMLILSCVLVGCTLGASGNVVTITPSSGTPTSAAQVVVPTMQRTLQPISTSPTQALTPTSEAPCLPSDQTPIRYEIDAEVDYSQHLVEAQQQIIYTNTTGVPLSEIVLIVEPNNYSGAFELQSLMLEGEAAEYTLKDRRLTVNLPHLLFEDCQIVLNLNFRVYPPFISGGITAYRGFFGYSERQMNLGLWLPMLAAYVDEEWVLNPIVFIGEQVALEQSDWDVTFELVGENTDVIIAAPGSPQVINATTVRYILPRARDFTASFSPYFQVRRQVAPGGTVVELYHFDDTRVWAQNRYFDAAAHSLDVATASLGLYASRFAPYPNERMVIVQGDFPDGMEFSGIVFVGSYWYTSYPGSARSYLTIITVHEVAHQWWYMLVGNDAAYYPWLDEALATYSEYLFYETYYADLTSWWWDFRVNAYDPQGGVDSTVYDFAETRPYINAIYLRGARMLHELRETLGDEAFFDLLRRYVTTEAVLATPQTFWGLLTPEQLQQTASIRAKYFSQPDDLLATRER